MRQSDPDYEHLIIRDQIGRGVPWANKQLADRQWDDINGKYVYILDDDNKMYHDAIEAIKAAAGEDCQHDMIIFRINRSKSRQRDFPENEYWRRTPEIKHIDIGNVVLRRGLFIDAVKHFSEIYEGDFDFIMAAYWMAASVIWDDYKIMRLQRISAGGFEV